MTGRARQPKVLIIEPEIAIRMAIPGGRLDQFMWGHSSARINPLEVDRSSTSYDSIEDRKLREAYLKRVIRAVYDRSPTR